MAEIPSTAEDAASARARKLAPPEEDLQLAASVLCELGRFVSGFARMMPARPPVLAEVAGNTERLERVATWLRRVVQSWHWGESLAPREVPTPVEVLRLAIVAYCPRHAEALGDLARVLAAHPPLEHLRYAVCVLDASQTLMVRDSPRDRQRENVATWLAAVIETAERVHA